jgi:hypothetical protein
MPAICVVTSDNSQYIFQVFQNISMAFVVCKFLIAYTAASDIINPQLLTLGSCVHSRYIPICHLQIWGNSLIAEQNISRFPESLISPKKFLAQMVGCNDSNLEPSIHYVTTIWLTWQSTLKTDLWLSGSLPYTLSAIFQRERATRKP